MTFVGNHLVLKTKITCADYDFILRKIEKQRKEKKKHLLICPIASQTIFLALKDNRITMALDRFNYIVPCSEWVKKSLNFLYNINLKTRVYGPDLMLKTCKLAEDKKMNIFLYGTTTETLTKLQKELLLIYPKIHIVASVASKFAPLSTDEKNRLIRQIGYVDTDILFIGIGSPLQELFTYDLFIKKNTRIAPITIMTVGASFDFIAKIKPQATKSVQYLGLEWFFRLLCEPKRLWKRYLIFGPLFILLVFKQKITLLLNSTNHIVVKNKTRS